MNTGKRRTDFNGKRDVKIRKKRINKINDDNSKTQKKIDRTILLVDGLREAEKKNLRKRENQQDDGSGGGGVSDKADSI